MKTFLLKLAIFSITCFVLLNLVAIFYDTTSRRSVEDPGGNLRRNQEIASILVVPDGRSR